MNIVFHVGYSAEPWCPLDVDKYGLGGTEQCVINIAEQLSSFHNIYVTGEVRPGIFNNVNYINMHEDEMQHVKTMDIDFLIGVSYAHFLKEFEGCRVNKRIFWLHNTEPHLWWKGEELDIDILERVDEFVLLTEWHAGDFQKRYGFEKPISIIGNGINLSKIKTVSKKENTVLYTSHAERGLSEVLNSRLYEMLKCDLKVTTPEYGKQYIKEHYISNPDYFDSKYDFLGSLPISRLYNEMSKAKWWHYPTDYEETYCITALEMLAHGVTPVLENPIAGLKETLNGLYVLPHEALQGKTIDQEKAKEYIKTRDWAVVAKQWLKLLKPQINISTYVISMNPMPDIEERLSPLLKDADVYIHHAVDGNNISTDIKYSLYPWKINSSNDWWNRNLKYGEVGCMLSHLEVLNEAYNSGLDYVLVLEEDFKALEEFNITDLPNTNWDICFLGRNANEGDQSVINEKFVVPGYSYNTHAILYRRSGIEKILQGNPQDFIMPWDEYLAATYCNHPRKDLSFIWQDINAIAYANDIVGQTSTSESSYTENSLEVSNIMDTSDWEAWKRKWLAYEALTKEWDLITDEPVNDVFTFKLFNEEFCKEVIRIAEQQDEWETDRHEYYPTIDVLLEKIGLNDIYQKVLEEYVYPCVIHLWTLEGAAWPKMYSENFMIKYTEHKQGHLSLHHDFSDISCVLALNDEYEGGGTYFARQKKLHKGKPGYISMHPGAITHLHGGRPVHKGERYIIVSFCRRTK